jgi:hypothetical protein
METVTFPSGVIHNPLGNNLHTSNITATLQQAFVHWVVFTLTDIKSKQNQGSLGKGREKHSTKRFINPYYKAESGK